MFVEVVGLDIFKTGEVCLGNPNVDGPLCLVNKNVDSFEVTKFGVW